MNKILTWHFLLASSRDDDDVDDDSVDGDDDYGVYDVPKNE